MNFAKFLRTTFVKEQLRWLLQYIQFTSCVQREIQIANSHYVSLRHLEDCKSGKNQKIKNNVINGCHDANVKSIWLSYSHISFATLNVWFRIRVGDKFASGVMTSSLYTPCQATMMKSTWKYTNADLKICQYFHLHMKIICLRFYIKTLFTFWDMRT